MKSKKSHLYYSASLKEESRDKVLNRLRSLTPLWVDEDDLCHCLCRAAEEFFAGVRETIEVDVVPSGRSSGSIGLIRLELDDFVVYDTEPEEPVLVSGISQYSETNVKKL